MWVYTCPYCGNEYDGNAQCPCEQGIDALNGYSDNEFEDAKHSYIKNRCEQMENRDKTIIININSFYADDQKKKLSQFYNLVHNMFTEMFME